MFNHTVFADSLTLPFPHLFLDLGAELTENPCQSVNRSVVPHLGAGRDPPQGGAAFSPDFRETDSTVFLHA